MDKEFHDLINELTKARLRKQSAQEEEDMILTKIAIYLERMEKDNV